MAKVLVVYHSLGGNTKAAADAVAEGVRTGGAEAVVKTGLEAGVDDLMGSGAIAVGTPDYFSYMAGGLKDFFDRTYYPTKGKTDGKPCGVFVTHGGGGKAVESMRSICNSFKFKLAAEPVLVKNKPDNAASDKLRELGKLLAKAAGAK